MSKTFVAVVGENQKEFMLHTNVASRSSGFFRAAMNNDWRESQQNRVTLGEIEASEFERYLQWLSTHDHSFLDGISFRRLAKLYILGDFLDDSAFRMDMLKRFTSKAITTNTYPDLGVIILVWEQTPEHSPLRKLIVETWITSSIKRLAEMFANADQDAPKAFIVDCLHRISETMLGGNESIKGDSRMRVLESCRDKVLKEIGV